MMFYIFCVKLCCHSNDRDVKYHQHESHHGGGWTIYFIHSKYFVLLYCIDVTLTHSYKSIETTCDKTTAITSGDYILDYIHKFHIFLQTMIFKTI